jgi:hypothetical protein
LVGVRTSCTFRTPTQSEKSSRFRGRTPPLRARVPRAHDLLPLLLRPVGNYPSLVRLYDPKVRSTIGRTQIASVYSDNHRTFLSVGVPKIVDTQRGGAGLTLAVEVPATEGRVIQESHLLRQRKGGWGIAYDTFFDRALGNAARVLIDGSSGKASVRGTQAARRASNRFRELFLAD